MSIQIRKIIESDFSSLISLFQEFALFEKLPENMTNSSDKMVAEKKYIDGYVALVEGEIIAYATCFFAYYTWSGKSMYMDDLYVKTEFRGRGIGTSLINTVIAFAKAENCRKLKWQVSEWNQPAIEFYQKLGATVDGVEANCELVLGD